MKETKKKQAAKFHPSAAHPFGPPPPSPPKKYINFCAGKKIPFLVEIASI
jgi:hypothetical protein